MSTALAASNTSTTPNKKAAKAAAAPKAPRVMPWEDLPANPDLQKEPREKSTISAVLLLLRDRKQEGATFDELQKDINALGHQGTHEVRQLLRWMSANRGWGFHQKKDGRIVLVTKNAEK